MLPPRGDGRREWGNALRNPCLACGLGHSAGLKAPRAFIQDRGAASLPRPTVTKISEMLRIPALR